MIYGIGGTPPGGGALAQAPTASGAASVGYHYAGAETNGTFGGGRATIEVGDPDVNHSPGVSEHVVARPLAKTPAGRWVEAGWAEVSWSSDTRYVYSFDNPENVWHLHTQYPLSVGNYYIFRVRDNGFSSGWAEIYWAGAWNLLETNDSMLCLYSYGTRNCRIEEYTEVYSNDGSYPNMNAPTDGSGVNFSSTMLRTDPSTWVYWNDSLYPSAENADAPYSACWINRDWNFRTPAGLC